MHKTFTQLAHRLLEINTVSGIEEGDNMHEVSRWSDSTKTIPGFKEVGTLLLIIKTEDLLLSPAGDQFGFSLISNLGNEIGWVNSLNPFWCDKNLPSLFSCAYWVRDQMAGSLIKVYGISVKEQC